MESELLFRLPPYYRPAMYNLGRALFAQEYFLTLNALTLSGCLVLELEVSLVDSKGNKLPEETMVAPVQVIKN